MQTSNTITLGVVPVKRSFLDMAEAKRQKDKFMAVIRLIRPDRVKIVDIDDLCENGIACEPVTVPKAINKFTGAGIDALFIPFCDFGEESVAAAIAGTFKLPTLVWGARDEQPNLPDKRGRDTQCGMFAATKVLRRFGVTYSYIYNVATESEEFKSGYLSFIRVVSALKRLKGLRIGKIGERPSPFMSVMTNEADLISRFGISTTPLSPSSIISCGEGLVKNKDPEYLSYYESLKKRFDTKKMKDDDVRKTAWLTIATKRQLEQNNCSAGAFECWSAFSSLAGLTHCVAVGDLTDLGVPLSCECDINGAISMAILQAVDLYDASPFLADLTIRNPENENSELLWHCGPFPYSLKSPSSEAALIAGQEWFELKQGGLTLCRFDDVDGSYSLFAGQGKTTTGPKTIGTYVWLEVDNWKRWEEKLMFGPYIHHVGALYGSYLSVLREIARYLGIAFDNAHEQGIYSL
jgi:L-fucose isomerase-like protein